MFVYIYTFMCVYMLHVHRFLWRPEEGVRWQGTRIIGNCEAPNMDAGN